MDRTQDKHQQWTDAPDAHGIVGDDSCFWPCPLLLSTASKVWRKHASTHPGRECQHDAILGARSGGADEACIFCGFTCSRNETHHRNDNHQDARPDNLGAICTICHRWQHLGDLPSGGAYLCYLPGLSPQNASHLLRTLFVALGSDDTDARADAHALLNWMASHRIYVEQAWGSCEPAVFASALLRQSAEEKEWREISFGDLALVVSPACVADAATSWRNDTYRELPVSAWPRVYHDIVNAPL
ncbi:HNH endonuclease [Massilia sp. NR 4-1]|uniref:HNH endonuclease n=1 Tax=Massilia sp. NR 4-1 TaxID=1678028 RepID=UPI000AA0FDC4|nr:HNH endonuclease [Massilia sp. NR 4-1]